MDDETPSPDRLPDGLEHRADRAWHLRKQGKSLSDIAVLEGFSSPAEVHRAIARRMESQAQAITSLERQTILAMELELLGDLQAAHIESALYGDIKSGEFILKIMAQRMKYLQLDQPDADTSQQTVLVVGQKESDYVTKLQSLVEDA